MTIIDHRKLYRFPWSLTDNCSTWLEVTYKCNLHCDGCYRQKTDEYMSIEEIEKTLDEMDACRTFDAVSLAGGDPLLHPNIVEIVRIITERGWKARIYSNGLDLNEDLLRRLEEAGLICIVLHIDSKQGRPDWEGKTEIELNELRLHYARMIAKVGGLICEFNMTVFGDTLHYVPEILKWGQAHMNIVHSLNFICFRQPETDKFYFMSDGRNVNEELPYYKKDNEVAASVFTEDIVEKIVDIYPDFQPAAYLNGTVKPDSLKWLTAFRYGNKKKIYGYIGPRFVEIQQTLHHLFFGRYLAFPPKGGMGLFNLVKLSLLFDSKFMKAKLKRLLNVKSWRRKLQYQMIAIVQPTDILDDGRQNMCDGCPDMIIWNGKLVWSCRLEECLKFGQMLHTVKRCPENEIPAESRQGSA